MYIQIKKLERIAKKNKKEKAALQYFIKFNKNVNLFFTPPKLVIFFIIGFNS